MMNSFTEGYLIFKVLSVISNLSGSGTFSGPDSRRQNLAKRIPFSLGIFTPCSSIFFVVRRNIFDDGLE